MMVRLKVIINHYTLVLALRYRTFLQEADTFPDSMCVSGSNVVKKRRTCTQQSVRSQLRQLLAWQDAARWSYILGARCPSQRCFIPRSLRAGGPDWQALHRACHSRQPAFIIVHNTNALSVEARTCALSAGLGWARVCMHTSHVHVMN